MDHQKFDQMMEGHMPAGFEMLINNFSVGIFGMILAIFGYYLIGPLMEAILAILTVGGQRSHQSCPFTVGRNFCGTGQSTVLK